MNDYIINLGLEFGLRIRLAVSNMNQLGTKKLKWGRGILVNYVIPFSFFLLRRRPPGTHLFLFASTSPSPLQTYDLKHQNPAKFLPPLARKSSNFTSLTSYKPTIAKSGQNSKDVTTFLVDLGGGLKHERMPWAWPCNLASSGFNLL